MARSIAGAAPGRTNRRFLIIAVLLAGLSATLMYAVLARGDSSGGSDTISAGSTQVVVAKERILQNTPISAEQLDLKSVPTNLVSVGAFVSMEDVVGTVAKYPLDANQQITSTAVIDTDNPALNQGLSVVVPAGQRAMSIQASQVGNAGGLILPGDFVDLIWVCCDNAGIISKTLIKNVQVAAVAQTVGLGPSERPSADGAAVDPETGGPVAVGESEALPDADTITLLVTPEQAQQIFLAEQTGTFRADLRGPGDLETPDTAPTLFFDILPPADLERLPDILKPDGYKPGQ